MHILLLIAIVTIVACMVSKDVRAVVLRFLPQVISRLLGRVL